MPKSAERKYYKGDKLPSEETGALEGEILFPPEVFDMLPHDCSCYRLQNTEIRGKLTDWFLKIDETL